METGCCLGSLAANLVDVDSGGPTIGEENLAVVADHIDGTYTGSERHVPWRVDMVVVPRDAVVATFGEEFP